MNLPRELRIVIKEKFQKCECGCDAEHSTEITTCCDFCFSNVCNVCEGECLVEECSGFYCWYCIDSLRFDTFGNPVSFNGNPLEEDNTFAYISCGEC